MKQPEKGEASQDLPRLDLAENEIRADQDPGIALVTSSSGKLLSQECEALITIAAVAEAVLVCLTEVSLVQLAVAET